MSEIRMYLAVLAIALGAALGCGDESATNEVDKVGAALEENVEQSGKTYKDTYDEARAEGEDAVDAAGDAYNAVLDEGREKEKEKEAHP